MATHAQAVTGTGGTAAASITQIGATLILPADGPWNIWGLWAMAVQDTGVLGEAVGGSIIVDSVAGDIVPDPAPGRWPCFGISSQSAASFGIHATPLNIWPVNWTASGKAQISLSYLNDAGNAVAPIVAAGILFGDKRPDVVPHPFADRVSASLTAAAEATIGTITLAEKATRITGIMCTFIKDGAITADEGMMGTVRLASDDMKMPPAVFPFNQAFSAADGTPAGGTGTAQAQIIPLDIPVTGGSRVNCFGTLVNAVTAGVQAQVFLFYQ